MPSLNYKAVVHYANGKVRDERESYSCSSIFLSLEEYKEAVKGLLVEKRPLRLIPSLSGVFERMKEQVIESDPYYNLSGSHRAKKLKAPRKIESVEIYVDDTRLHWIGQRKNPMNIFEYDNQEMIIYRDDGSTLTLKYTLGTVEIQNSKDSTVRIVSSETFANELSR